MSEKIDYSKGIYDARQLGTGRMLILGVQHMFAMFGATVLVPLLTGLSVSTTLLCAGLGTLLFHLVTRGKVPAFLGSSFAYLGGFSIVAPMLADANGNLTVTNTKMLPYACAGVAFSGILYLVVSLLISTFGIRRIMKFFPPVVTGPIIISIGLILAPSAITNCESNWLLAFVALGTVIVCNIWGKGMVKILPILIGVLVSYAVALVTGAVDFQAIAAADWFGIPLHQNAMGLFAIDGSPEFISALFTILPIGNVDNINFMLPMFWLGYFCQKEQEVIDRHRRRLLIASLVAFAALLPFWSGRLTVYMVPIQVVDWTNGTVDWTNLNITVYRMIIGIVGSMVFFLSAPWVYGKIEHGRLTPTLNNLGKCTLGIYWTQTFLLECTLHGLGFYVGTAGSFIAGPVVATIELILCYQVVLLLKKHRYTRLLLLGEK